MRVRRIGFLGVRTDRVADTTAFFREVVGLRAVATADARTVTQLPTGTLDFVEVFAEDFRDARLIPDEAERVFVAFIVEDLEEARGEVEVGEHGARGIAVHEVARIAGAATPGEIWLSETTVALTGGAGLKFDDRGQHELKGIQGTRHLYAYLASAS